MTIDDLLDCSQFGPAWDGRADAPRAGQRGGEHRRRRMSGRASAVHRGRHRTWRAADAAGGTDGRPGFYHRVLAERLVDGSIVVLRSDHDRALGTLYGAITGSGQVDRRRRVRATRATNGGGGGSMRATVATSTLGAVGARGVGAPEAELLQAQQIGIPQFRIVDVDGSQVVEAQDFLIGARRDIFHREVATLIALSAGVLVGGPDGVRPRPRDPLVSP
jgi:hypothetical protein